MTTGNESTNKIQIDELSDIEKDIIETHRMNNLTVLDEIDSKLHILDGSLNFAMNASDDSQSGFFQGLNDHVKNISDLLNKIRG